MLIHVSRHVLFFNTLHPAHVVVVSLTAVRTRVIRLLDLLPLVEDVTFLHHANIVAFWGVENRVAWGLRVLTADDADDADRS